MNKTPFIVIKDLTKIFKGRNRSALDNLNAQIDRGQMVGLVGPDGSGKTTLLRLLIGLLDPDKGSVTINGLDSRKQADQIQRLSGYMPQKFGLYEDLTVIENMTLYADLRNMVGTLRKERFEELLAFTDLARFKDRLAGRLSGGMKQKLGLACVLIGTPDLLLLDEPSVGVDPISRRELWRMVTKLAQDGLTVLWATSYLDEAEKCAQVILLHQGQNLYSGPPEMALDLIKGRSYALSGLHGRERRKAFMSLLKDREVADGLIQGGDIKIVTKKEDCLPALPGSWRKIKPSFEDAFIELLGGPTLGESTLAVRMEEKPTDGAVVVEANNLTKRFGDFTAVLNNSFQIKRGHIFGLLGPNGAGKSTTFKMMCGLIKPTSGEAKIAGYSLVNYPSQARSRIGYMAQKFSLYEQLSVAQNLTFFSGAYGLFGHRQKEQIELMEEVFDLHSYMDVSSAILPLGIKQRLALACAVMHQPDVLFLDEPTSGVDPLTRREFWLHINHLAIKGVTVMITTHFMEEAEYCDLIALIFRGRNIASGSPDELKALVRSKELENPTMEDAFIELIKQNELHQNL
ncbi:MAG: ATP-binding cassette domain-containing protein [Deltaproteobacteria bacterium]|nr:ATP-binding cassette domain-containing protein [Deltaproteobacteria bacterium]